MTPEEKEAKRIEGEKRIADWKAANPERFAEIQRKAKETVNKFLEERNVLRETNLDAYMAIINNEPQASRNPELLLIKEERSLVATEMRNDAIEKKKAEHEKMVAERKAARDKK